MTNAKLEWCNQRPGCRRALMPRAALVPCGLLALALLLAGCATTKVDVLWSNPEFATRKMEGKVLVVGLTRDQTMRRVYEDELAAQFAARGFGARGRVRFFPVPWSATNT